MQSHETLTGRPAAQSARCSIDLHPTKARLAYLTTQDAIPVLNLQTQENSLMRIEINRDQLAGIILEGVRALLGELSAPRGGEGE